MNKQSQFPPGWDEARVESVRLYYENQTEEEALAELEAAWKESSGTLIEVPNELVPAVHELIAKSGR